MTDTQVKGLAQPTVDSKDGERVQTIEVGPPEPKLKRTAAAPDRGQQIGRYLVLETVGAGGMGVVYRAYDPKLRREIALKLVKVGSRARGDQQARLLREAQVMAQLADPHVVPVHDVGTVHGELFIAMEYVEGSTMSRWIGKTSPGWKDVIRAFIQAGQGLAAAHAAGLVHRDFKPSNVLMGKDGRVRVMDFGLARPSTTIESEEESEEPVSLGPGGRDPFSTPVTVAGAIIGTPQYMAPEQMRGAPPDARSDQFSFCLALFEGLYRCRAFRGERPKALVKEIEAGRIRPAPRKSAVPLRLRRIVVRGLSADPQARWPSMGELLKQLRHNPWRARRRIAAGSASAIAIAGGVWGVVADHRAQEQACDHAADAIAGVWDEDRKDEIESALVDDERAYTIDAWERVSAGLDGFAAAWVEMKNDNCQATVIRKEQGVAIMDLRNTCLDQRLADLKVVGDILARGGDDLAVEAPQIVERLDTLGECADLEALRSKPPEPEDDAARKEAARLRADLSRVSALDIAGQTYDALEIASGVLEEARALAYPPVTAEALRAVGQLRGETSDLKAAEKSLREAYWLALASGYDRAAAEAATSMVWVLAMAAKADAAIEWGGHARAVHSRLRGDGSIEALDERLLQSLGAAHVAKADFATAREYYERALAIARRTEPDDSVATAALVNNLATVLSKDGRLEEALNQYRRAIAIYRTKLGEHHPRVADVSYNAAVSLQDLGRRDEARDLYDEAQEIWSLSLGLRHPKVALAVGNIANLLFAEGDHDEAQHFYEHALSIVEAKLPDHPKTANALVNLCANLIQLHRLDEARRRCAQGLKIYDESLGPDHPDVAYALEMTASLEHAAGDLSLALQLYKQALAVREEAQAPGHATTADALAGIAEVLIDLKRHAEAREHVQRAIEIRTAAEGAPRDLAQLRFILARALWSDPAQRKRALSLAERALVSFTQTRDRSAPEVKAWLHQRRAAAKGRKR